MDNATAEFINTFPIVPKSITVEDNIFDIGTRGFYENPFTEVLTYLLSPDGESNDRTLNEFIARTIEK